MTKRISTVVAIIACVLLAFNTIKIISLQEELDKLRSDVNDEIHTVNQNVSDIYDHVQAMLEEENNQLSVSDWEYGEITVDTRTAEITCTVIPKIYTPGVTQGSIVCNGREYALTYADGQYITTIELPLFETSQVTQVKLNDNGTIRTQELNWQIAPRYEVLLNSYVGMGGSASGKPGDNEYLWSTEYTVNIDIQCQGKFQVQSVEVVEVLDGEEIGRIPVDISNEGQDAYYKAFVEKGEAVPKNFNTVEKESPVYNGQMSFLYYLNEDYHIPNGSMLELYVDVIDGNGLRYRSFAEAVAVDSNGKLDDARAEEKRKYSFAEPVFIFDSDGTVLYEIDPSLFR